MIVSTPGTCGGKPRIDGHRIRVQDVVHWSILAGISIDEIVQEHPGLDSAKVGAALDYYRRHRDEIDRQMKEDEEFADSVIGGEDVVIYHVSRKVDAEILPSSPA